MPIWAGASDSPLTILSAIFLAVSIGMAKPMPLFSPFWLKIDVGTPMI